MIPTICDKPFQYFCYGRYKAPMKARLSSIQVSIVNMYTAGFKQSQIASRLGVSTGTIRNHRIAIEEKGYSCESGAVQV